MNRPLAIAVAGLGTVERADDAHRDGGTALQGQRVADGNRPLADPDLIRRCGFGNRQRLVRLDLQENQHPVVIENKGNSNRYYGGFLAKTTRS